MIIRLCQDTPMISVAVLRKGCDAQQLMDTGVYLCIYKPTCCLPPKTFLIKKDCTWERVPAEPPIPILTYPAFELDCEGRVTFFFDEKLWSLPPGRYRAVVVADRKQIGNAIDIDLCSDDAYVAEVAVTSTKPCGEQIC